MIDAILLALAQLLAGWLIADLLGGIAHWLEDRILTVRTPMLGGIVAANRLHHAEPLAFIGKNFLERHLATWATAGAISLLWLMLFGPSLVWLAATIGGAISSGVHFLAHGRSDVRLVRILQDVGLLQSAAHHAGHHRPGAARRYCVLTALLNPVLDGIGLWAWLERIAHRCGIAIADDQP
jgi:hypothetical protein